MGLGSDLGAVVMLDPRTGQVLAMASTPDVQRLRGRESGDGRGGVRGTPATTAQPAPQSGDPGPLRARLRVQDRDRDRGSRFRRDHACDDLPAAAGRPSRTASLVDGFKSSDGRNPLTYGKLLDLYTATEVS